MQAAGVGDKAAKAGGRQGRHNTVISAKGVKRIADALFEDGYRNDDVCRLSQLDLHHEARDLDRITVEAIPFMKAVTPYRFKIPIENTDDRGIKHVVHQMLLPHELMAAVYADNESMFHQIFGTRALEEFWSRQKSERLTRHPAFQGRRSKWIIPLRLFGDDAPVCNTNSVDTLLLCSCTAYKLPALLSKLPLCCTPIKHTDHSTFDAIHRVVMWSLEILASGVWPATIHEGGQWPETDRRYQLGRQQSRLICFASTLSTGRRLAIGSGSFKTSAWPGTTTGKEFASAAGQQNMGRILSLISIDKLPGDSPSGRTRSTWLLLRMLLWCRHWRKVQALNCKKAPSWIGCITIA